MPDDEAYRTFWALLSRPDTWTVSERSVVEFALQEQRAMLAAVHPKDERRRRSLAKVVEQIEGAIAKAEGA